MIVSLGLLFVGRATADEPEFHFTSFAKPNDTASTQLQDNGAIFTISSSDGIGAVSIQLKNGQWPRDCKVLLKVRNLESLEITTDRLWAHGALRQSGQFPFSLRNAEGDFEKYDPTGHRVVAGTLDIRVKERANGMEIIFPANLFIDTKNVTVAWIDAFRR